MLVAFVTRTATVPDPDGEVAVIEVAPFTVTLVGVAEPNFTVEVAVKLVPVMVTTVPPDGLPDGGLIEVIVGAGSVP